MHEAIEKRYSSIARHKHAVSHKQVRSTEGLLQLPKAQNPMLCHTCCKLQLISKQFCSSLLALPNAYCGAASDSVYLW
jgi:hypothetical protein